MSASKLRSTSTNSRIKINHRLDTSAILANANNSVNSIPNSLSKSRERLPAKLPRLTPSSRESSNSYSQDLSEDSLHQLKQSLQQEWDKRSVPLELQKTFNDKVWSLPRHKAAAIASNELDDLKKNRSAMMTALRAVIAREESLVSINEMEKFLKQVPNWEKLREVQLECAELLHAHRILTINAVETIVKWRESIIYSALVNNQTSSMHIPFVYKGSNYIVKVKNDLDFLVSSEFKKVFSFDKNDPLLIKPSVPAVKTKEKKIDSNYFIQHGQVVVSLPGSLRLKVDSIEEAIAREIKLENVLEPKQVEELSKVIYEELCEEEVTNDAIMYFGNNKSEVKGPLSEELMSGLLEDILGETVKEVKRELQSEGSQKLSENLMEKIIEAEIDRVLKETVKNELREKEKEKKESLLKQQRVKEENENLARSIYVDLFNDLVYSLGESMLNDLAVEAKEADKRNYMAKLQKENNQIAEKIASSYIEEEVSKITAEIGDGVSVQKSNKVSLEGIYNDIILQMIKETVSETYSEIKTQKDSRKAQQLDDLSNSILNSLIDGLLPDIQSIAQSAFDYEIQLYSDRSELIDNIGFNFINEETLLDPSGFIFQSISAPDSVMPQIIEEYFPRIPSEELSVTAEKEILEEEISKLEAHWFWGLKGNIIVGLLVFSVDFDRNDVRVINVHHITCLNWKYYRQFVEQACKFIWDSDHCQEVRIHLYIAGDPEIPLHIKKHFNELKFRWKTNIVNEDEDLSIVVMGKMRPQIKMPGIGKKINLKK